MIRRGRVTDIAWALPFLSDLCVFGYIFYEKVPIETFYISSQSTHNKQQAGIKNICIKERGKKL